MRILNILAGLAVAAGMAACSSRTTYVERQPAPVVQAPPGAVVVPQNGAVVVKP